ncbi:MAG: GAF domain-containing protein [Anaerolineales bacterium]|nr:GAF domain-containing protein [Anaerolineales bacterium]
MLKNLRDFFTLPPTFEHDEEITRQARLLFRALQIAWAVPLAAVLGSALVRANAIIFLPIGGAMVIVITVMIHMLRRGQIRSASTIFLSILVLASIYADFVNAGQIRAVTMLIAVAIVAAGLLMGGRGAAFVAAALIIGHGLIILAFSQGLIQSISPPTTPMTNFAITSIAFAMIAINFGLASNSLNSALLRARQSEQELIKTNRELQDLEQAQEARILERTAEADRRARQLQMVADMSNAIASVQDMEHLLPAIAQLISERFEFYHVGIFLVDETGKYAVLRASNSIGGQTMLARNHRLKVGEQGIVGYVTGTGRPRIALDVGEDAVFFNNPELPETSSEMALPLTVRAQVIGALDIQSTQQNAFQEEDIAVIATLANQVAIAIQNARLFEQARQALVEAENAYAKLTGQNWKDLADAATLRGYFFDGATAYPLTELPEQPGKKLAVPVQLRGQILGFLNINPDDQERVFNDNEIAVINAAAERVALALENARLFEDAQRRAATERAIGEITSKISGSVNLRNVLQTTVQELGRALPGSEVIIQLQSELGIEEAE